MADIFDEINPGNKGDIFDKINPPKPTPVPPKPSAHQAGVDDAKKHLSSVKDDFNEFVEHPFKSVGNALGRVASEPFRIATDLATGAVSGANKLSAGAGAFVGTLETGGGFENALAARRKAAAAETRESPPGPSYLTKAIGGVVGPATSGDVGRLENATGNTGLIGDVVDIGGDIAALMSIKPTVNALRSGIKSTGTRMATEGLPFTKKNSQYKAAQILDEANNPLSTRQASVQARNELTSGKIKNNIQSLRPAADRVEFPTAATKGSKDLASFQNSEANTNPKFKGALEKQEDTLIDSAHRQAKMVAPSQGVDIRTKVVEAARAKQNAAAAAGKQLEDTTSQLDAAPAPQTVGENIISSLRDAEKPIADRTAGLYDKLPDYTVHEQAWQPVQDAIEGVRKVHLDDTQRGLVDEQIRYLEGAPRTTGGLEEVDKSLGNAAARARQASPPNKPAAKFIGELQRAVRNVADEMGVAADTGDIALSGKQIVRPSVIKQEIADLEKQLRAATTAPAALPRQNSHLYVYLKEHGVNAGMQRQGLSDIKYNQELKQTLEKSGLKDYEPLTTATSTPEQTANLQQGIAARQKVLDNLQPAENFATAYKAARASAKEQADRFRKGSVADALQQGDEFTGSRMQSEDMPRRFADASGADDLIRAVGPEKASDLMRPHFAREAAGKLNGTPKQIADWVSRNRDVLKKYGLYDDFSNVQRVRESVADAQAAIDAHNKSVVGKLFTKSGITGEIEGIAQSKIVPTIMEMPNPRQAFRDLLEYGKDVPGWKDGVKVLLRDHMESRLTKSNLSSSIATPELSFAEAKTLAKQFKDVIPEVFSKAEIAKMEGLYLTLRKVAQTRSAGAYGGNSATATNLTGNTKARLMYYVARDGMHVVAPGAISVGAAVAGFLTKMQVSEIEGFVQSALLDPRKAATLEAVLKGDHSAHTTAYLRAQMKAYAKQAAKAAGASVVGQSVNEETDNAQQE